MGVAVYEIAFDEGGSEQNVDLQYLKDLREQKPGVIKLYDMTFRVENDPAVKIYQTNEEAEAVRESLKNLYNVTPVQTLVSPQPAGLND